MKKNTTKPRTVAPAAEKGFVKRTISLPPELMDYAVDQASAPEYAGNLSAFLRNLIVAYRRSA